MRLKTLLLCGLLFGLAISVSGRIEAAQAQVNLAQSNLAQSARTPLLMLITSDGQYGDLWAWNSAGKPLKQLTNWGYNLNPVISPDGKYIAYDSVPQIAIPPRCSGWPPFNIWVMEISTGDAFRIADQPANATYCGDSPTYSFILRPQPAWSPDSKFLAWGDSVNSSDAPNDSTVPYRLVVYDLVKRKQQVVVEKLPGFQGITNGQPVDWSENGIADTAFDAQNALPLSLNIYDSDGKLLHTTGFAGTPCYLSGLSGRWIMDGTNTTLAICADNKLSVVDPVTGQHSNLDKQLELYSLSAPHGLSFINTVYEKGTALWTIALDGQAIKDIHPVTAQRYEFGLNQLAISPDGEQVAFVTDEGLFVYDQKALTQIPIQHKQVVGWIGWGATALRLNGQ